MASKKEFLTYSILAIAILGLIITMVGDYIRQNAHNEHAKSNTKTAASASTTIISCNNPINQKQNAITEQAATSGQTAITVGYFLTTFSIFFIMILSVSFNVLAINNPIANTKIIISSSLPSLITMGIIIYAIVLNFKFKDQLISGKVAKEYYSYSRFSSIMLILQTILLIRYILAVSNNNKDMLSINCLIFILSIINLLLLGIQQVILKFFSTDG